MLEFCIKITLTLLALVVTGYMWFGIYEVWTWTSN